MKKVEDYFSHKTLYINDFSDKRKSMKIQVNITILHGMQEVIGSTPIFSTNLKLSSDSFFCYEILLLYFIFSET